MKYLIKNIVLTLILLLFNVSCDDPLPTELINNEEEVDIAVINPEPNSIVITGYDSTGITNPIPEKQSIISLSGIKTTVNGRTFYKAFGEAVFYDTSKPVFINQNKIIGYKTLEFGKVKVGKDTAKIVPHLLKYRENFVLKDTLVGVKHIISYGPSLLPSGNKLPYNKNIKIEFINKNGSPSLLFIKIPEEIKGRMNVTGSRAKNNLKIDLSWNHSFTGSDEIIVGGIIQGSRELEPLFRLKNFKKNKFTIPNSLIKQILSGNYSSIVVSFIRKTRKTKPTSRLGDIYFASQSIHNIWIAL
jgi:hypothetical protein